MSVSHTTYIEATAHVVDHWRKYAQKPSGIEVVTHLEFGCVEIVSVASNGPME